MVGRLHNVDIVVVKIEGGDHQSRCAARHGPIAENLLERQVQRRGVVFGKKRPLETPPPQVIAKDDRSGLRVEVHDLRGSQTGTESESNDSTCGGAGNEVEVISDADAKILLKPSEERRRECTLKSSPVEGQNLESARPGGGSGWLPDGLALAVAAVSSRVSWEIFMM